jgi:hypothetical protein
MFHTPETRLGLGALSTPRTAVSTRSRSILDAPPAASQRPVPTTLCNIPSQGVRLTRHQRGFTDIHPMPSLPLTCDPRTERGPLGFSLSSAPD